MIELEHGQYANGPVQVAERWQRHFIEAKGGALACTGDLLSETRSRQQSRFNSELPFILSLDNTPSLIETTRRFAKAPVAKAAGEDGIPGDVFFLA